MKVSAAAAETASNGNGNATPDSPALAQLKAAIEPDQVITGDGSNSMADGVAATAILEAGEEDVDEDQQADDQQAADGNPGETPHPIPGDEIATETMDAVEIHPATGTPNAVANVAAIIGNPPYSKDPIVPAAPAPYDPIAEVDEEITENNERIVAHAIRASELDTMLKATKKSLKTAADEGVELAVRRAGLLLQQKEKAEREAAATAKAAEPVAPVVEVQKTAVESVPADNTASATPAAPESTEDFHARIAEQFAPDPAASLAPTPEQERYDHEFRSLAIEGLEGLTPKIVAILHHNQIFTVGNFQDVPKRGIEYTMLTDGTAKLTEVRYEKIMDAMMAYMKANPRPEGEPQPAPAPVAVESVPNTVTTAVVGGLDVDDI